MLDVTSGNKRFKVGSPTRHSFPPEIATLSNIVSFRFQEIDGIVFFFQRALEYCIIVYVSLYTYFYFILSLSLSPLLLITKDFDFSI